MNTVVEKAYAEGCGYNYRRELGIDTTCRLPVTHTVWWHLGDQALTWGLCCADHARVMHLRANPLVAAITPFELSPCGEHPLLPEGQP